MSQSDQKPLKVCPDPASLCVMSWTTSTCFSDWHHQTSPCKSFAWRPEQCAVLRGHACTIAHEHLPKGIHSPTDRHIMRMLYMYIYTHRHAIWAAYNSHCMDTCRLLHVYIHIHLCLYIYMHVHAYNTNTVYIYTIVHQHMHIHRHIYIYMHKYIDTHVYIYIHICLLLCIYACVYIYIL